MNFPAFFGRSGGGGEEARRWICPGSTRSLSSKQTSRECCTQIRLHEERQFVYVVQFMFESILKVS